MSRPGMAIGTAAAKSGCTISQIRYYEHVGLLRQAARTVNGRRQFGWPDVLRLRLLRQLRAAGYSIEGIRILIISIDAPQANCNTLRALTASRLDAIRFRMAELRALERTLASLAQGCENLCDAIVDPNCPLLKSKIVVNN